MLGDEEKTNRVPRVKGPDDVCADTNPIEETGDRGDVRGPAPHVDETLPVAFGRYVVQRILGSGGFGHVLMAHDPELDRRVAIKIPVRKINREEIDRFLQEARRLARLRHPGIVTVYDVGVQDGRGYIVCDLLQGKTIRQWLNEYAPTWVEVCIVTARIADALAHAHSQGTVHRDVKPGNVIMTDNLQPVLLDFGLALTAFEESNELGRVAGTPRYMSPEQVQGRAHRVDGRTDIYSLGVMLYEMLCGRPPFNSKITQELLRQICEDPPQPPRQLVRGLPVELEAICLKALAKKQEARFTTADDFAAALREVIDMMSPPPGVTVQTHVRSEPRSDSNSSSRFSRSRRDAEKRQVTLLISNCELNAADGELDPEEHQDVIAQFHQLCERAIERYGGKILSSSGEELLVCFGFPVGYEDAARRAVLAALDIRDASQELRTNPAGDSPVTLSAWSAVHTGTVVVGESAEVGSDTVTLMGEARNLIARLEGTVDPGCVQMTGATHRLVRGFFECQPLGERRLRGIPHPVSVFQVLRPSKKTNRIDVAESTGFTPLVGRDPEVQLLMERWEQANEGMGQVVLLSGDAGLGKSRLAHVLKNHVRQQFPQSPILELRCSPYHLNSSFWPVSECIHRLLDLEEQTAAEEKLAALVEYLGDLGFEEPEDVALFAAVLQIPTSGEYAVPPLSPQRLKERTQELLLDWLRECAAVAPVLFIVEDLHWIDPSTLELVSEHLAQCGQDSILTLLTFRPEFEPPWRNFPYQTQVALNRLTRRQVAEMMCQKANVRHIPDAIVDQVADRTDGVPLFVEEFTRMVVESATAREIDGELEISGSFPTHEIPATLQDLLIARLDRLDAGKEVAQLAAACGREFSLQLLSYVADQDESATRYALEKLVQAELVFQRGRGKRSRYFFKHALIQDAAYGSILRKKRREIHLRIATALAERFPEVAESEPELLAHHFTEAALPERAIPYWLTAGRKAQDRWNHLEAIAHFQRGLAAIESLDQTVPRDELELQFQAPLGTSLVAAKGYAHPEAGAALQRARELAVATDNTLTLFFVTWGIWARHLLLDELDRCLEVGSELLELAKSTDEPGLEMEALDAPGTTAVHLGDFPMAKSHLERGIALYDKDRCQAFAKQTGQNAGVVEQVYLSIAIWALGYPDQARALVDSAVALADTLEDPFSLAHACNHGAWVHHFCRDADKTIALADRARQVSSEQAFAFWEACALVSRGAGLTLRGESRAAIEQVTQGLQAFQATGARLHLCYGYGILGEAHLQLGELDVAKDYLRRALAAADAANERYVEAELLRLMAVACHQSGDIDLAADFLDRAIQVARRQQAKSWELRAATALVRLLPERRAETKQILKSVYDWFTEGFDTQDLIDARNVLESGAD